jgi:hypothetical protein
MFWFQTQVHLRTRKPHVKDIPAIFLKERHIMFNKRTGLLVPYNEAFSPDPLPKERHQVIDSAVKAGKAPANVLISSGTTLILKEPETSSQTKRSDLEAKASSSHTTRAKSMPAALNQAEKWDRSAPRSPHSTSDSVRRRTGLLLEQERSSAIDDLRSSLPPTLPTPEPRAQEAVVQASDQLKKRKEQLQPMNKNTEYKDNINKDIPASAKHTAKTRKACSYVNPNSTLIKITEKITANKKLNDPARVRLINKFYRECQGSSKEYDRVCYNHLQFIASKIELSTRTAGKDILQTMLAALYAKKQD